MASSKEERVLDAARQLFLENGFAATSVDKVAKLADVSKATLYAHFEDKKALFREVVRRATLEYSSRVFNESELDQGEISDVLFQVARNLLNILKSVDGKRLFRLAISESERHPDIGRSFFEFGPDLATRRLETLLRDRTRRGELEIPDPYLAAHQFGELCKAEVFYRTMFNLASPPTASELELYARRAVTTFLRAYRAT
ncbi:MAG: TetR/AcrR family transcriptional regulator [Myxococcota bacterium]